MRLAQSGTCRTITFVERCRTLFTPGHRPKDGGPRFARIAAQLVTLGALLAVATGAGAQTFTITSSAGPGGTITPLGAVVVSAGSDQSFTITPDACFAISDVVVDGSSVGTVGTYTF